ncbi:hypothetical protein TRIUR3_17942 [Triticum urartu]|uniref:Uncharacterized protein n=1 Tax=Triticum urartu TaxID=4572 RepID=M7Z310_TRIUA|nr:hypothetical protein TRIUR3_17942 [Triticum urartu]
MAASLLVCMLLLSVMPLNNSMQSSGENLQMAISEQFGFFSSTKSFFSSINTGGRSNFVKLEKQEDTWEKGYELKAH